MNRIQVIRLSTKCVYITIHYDGIHVFSAEYQRPNWEKIFEDVWTNCTIDATLISYRNCTTNRLRLIEYECTGANEAHLKIFVKDILRTIIYTVRKLES